MSDGNEHLASLGLEETADTPIDMPPVDTPPDIPDLVNDTPDEPPQEDGAVLEETREPHSVFGGKGDDCGYAAVPVQMCSSSANGPAWTPSKDMVIGEDRIDLTSISLERGFETIAASPFGFGGRVAALSFADLDAKVRLIGFDAADLSPDDVLF